MTGYGQAKNEVSGKNISIEIKSVNSRYLDINCKMPRIYIRLEEKIKTYIGKFATRGKIDLYINIETLPDMQESDILLNHEHIKNYLSCLSELSKTYSLKNDVTVSSLLSNRDLFSVPIQEDDDADKLWEQIEGTLQQAAETFSEMKNKEGKRLSKDISEKIDILSELILQIEHHTPEIIKSYQEKLTQRIIELAGDIQFDETRLMTEVAIFADRVAIDEEIVRLRSHLSQFRDMLSDNTNVAVGRKLDFLLQEINREINTIGSKSNDTNIAKLVIDAKGEAEKIREQVQNIE